MIELDPFQAKVVAAATGSTVTALTSEHPPTLVFLHVFLHVLIPSPYLMFRI